MNGNETNCLTTTGIIEETMVRAGFDNAVLFAHVRCPTTVHKVVILLDANQVLRDGILPGDDVVVKISPCGIVEYLHKLPVGGPVGRG